MAKIRVYQTLDRGVIGLQFVNDLESLSEADKRAIQKFGEPEVNFGGDFSFTVGQATVVIPVPNQYAKIVSGFPVKMLFPLTSLLTVPPATFVDAYRVEILDRINDVYVALRANADTVTNEYVQTI